MFPYLFDQTAAEGATDFIRRFARAEFGSCILRVMPVLMLVHTTPCLRFLELRAPEPSGVFAPSHQFPPHKKFKGVLLNAPASPMLVRKSDDNALHYLKQHNYL
jgi:hypothetical protein